jgi:hypothetical protein
MHAFSPFWRAAASVRTKAPQVMPQSSAFYCDFRFPLILLSHAKSTDYRPKRIRFPWPLERLQPFARMHRNR